MVPQLLEIIDGEPVVSHRVIANNIGVQQKNVVELIRAHKSYFEGFGRLAFQTEVEKMNNQGGLKPITYYLNENQAIFLISLSKNTEQVVKFKFALVAAFPPCEKNKL